MEAVERLGLARLTIDVDGSVVRTGAKVAWAFWGFNPHPRKDLSYYPLRDVLSWLRRQHRRGERRSTAVRGGWGGAAVGAWRVADEAGEPSFRPLPSGRLDGHLTASRGCQGSTRPGDPRQFVEDVPAPATASGPMSCGCS